MDDVNAIPVMDDPLGRFWGQPHDIRSALMDDKHVILRPAQVALLSEYSSTFPSGVYPGKCWLRRERLSHQIDQRERLLLVWYGKEELGRCAVCFREILVLFTDVLRSVGTPISQLSGRPGHPGFDDFARIAASWGYD